MDIFHTFKSLKSWTVTLEHGAPCQLPPLPAIGAATCHPAFLGIYGPGGYCSGGRAELSGFLPDAAGTPKLFTITNSVPCDLIETNNVPRNINPSQRIYHPSHSYTYITMVQTSTIVAATVGTIATGLVGMLIQSSLTNSIQHRELANLYDSTAYAVYFDHKRRTDPEFRKQLKRESKRLARAAKEEAEAHKDRQRDALKAAVMEAQEDGFPVDVEEKEAYFMSEVARGEQLAQEGMFGTSIVRGGG